MQNQEGTHMKSMQNRVNVDVFLVVVGIGPFLTSVIFLVFHRKNKENEQKMAEVLRPLPISQT